MRKLTVLNLALCVLLIGFSIQVWPELPERIPRHFNAAGEVDAWSGKSPGAWFLLPAIGVATVLLLEVLGGWLLRRPDLVNLPSKKQFLELPAEEQAPILREMRLLVQGVGTLVLVMFGAIQLASYRAALGQPTRDLMVVVLVLAIAMGPVLAIVALARSSSQVSAAHRRAKLRGTLRQ